MFGFVRGRTMQRYLKIAALIGALGMIFGCVTTDHSVELKNPEIDSPVSASAYFIDQAGSTLSPENYTVVHHFLFERSYEGQIGKETVSILEIDAELENILEHYQADAVVNLQFQGIDYDPGATASTSWTRWLGIYLLGFDAIMLGTLYFMSAGDPYSSYTLGDFLSEEPFYALLLGGFGIGGAVSLGLSFILPATSPSVWQVAVEGDAVRRD
jgi:hypothetical protein